MDNKLIFISYATPDRSRVTSYYNDLSARGHDVWMDKPRLKPGQNWNFEIQRALNRAALIILFISKNSIDRRGFVQREIRIALDKAMEKLISDIYLLPVLLDDDAQLPDELKHIQAVRASDPDCKVKIDDAIRYQLTKADEEADNAQHSSEVVWSTTPYRDSWEGLPGYESEFRLLNFSSTKYPKIGEVTDIVRGSLLSDMADQRSVKLSQNIELFDFGQQPFSRTNTWEAFPSEPNIVGRVLSFHYSVHWYGAGAAHPNMHFVTFCFLLDPFICIRTLAEIFENSSLALAKIQELARRQLLADRPDEHTLQADWVISGTQDWDSFQAFTFHDVALNLHFSPYQVAPYSSGPQIVELSFDELKPLMKPWFRNALGIYYLRSGGDPASDAAQTPIYVKTVKAFIEGILSHTSLVVSNDKLLVGDGFPLVTGNLNWQDVFDGKELLIRGVSNLRILGDNAAILAQSRYAWTLTFSDCHNITLQNLTVGHVDSGYCQGGVLKFINCSGVKIENCDLFGCGTYGLELDGCSNIDVDGTTIRDCSYGILKIKNCRKVTFTESILSNNREFDLCSFFGQAEQIMFQRCRFEGNYSQDSLFNLKGITQAGSIVYVWNSKFIRNVSDCFQDDFGFFSERNNEYIDNIWNATNEP